MVLLFSGTFVAFLRLDKLIFEVLFQGSSDYLARRVFDFIVDLISQVNCYRWHIVTVRHGYISIVVMESIFSITTMFIYMYVLLIL